jgi:hypothetical protein
MSTQPAQDRSTAARPAALRMSSYPLPQRPTGGARSALAVALVVVAALLASGCGAADANGGGAASSPGDTPASQPAANAESAPAADGHDHGPAPSASHVPASGAQQKTFPPQDYLEKVVASYTVANERPELLTGLPCYCPCELYGHGGVIDCHRSQHAAMCNVCMDEAIEANRLYEAALSRGEADIAAVQQQVKDRYRRALVQQTAQQFPMTNTPQGQAFLEVCSDCHQPPSPAMHTAGDWDQTLTRMEGFARGNGTIPDQAVWDAAASYVKQLASQVPPATVAQTRRSLQSTVDHLQETEGDAAYYPSVRDDVLDPAWARRMADAYASARELPTELLAATPTTCKPCTDAGNTNLLACLNSAQAITCETAIEEIEALMAAQGR